MDSGEFGSKGFGSVLVKDESISTLECMRALYFLCIAFLKLPPRVDMIWSCVRGAPARKELLSFLKLGLQQDSDDIHGVVWGGRPFRPSAGRTYSGSSKKSIIDFLPEKAQNSWMWFNKKVLTYSESESSDEEPEPGDPMQVDVAASFSSSMQDVNPLWLFPRPIIHQLPPQPKATGLVDLNSLTRAELTRLSSDHNASLHIPDDPVQVLLCGILEKTRIIHADKVAHAATIYHPDAKDQDEWKDFIYEARRGPSNLAHRKYRNMPSKVKVPFGALSPEQAAFNQALSAFHDEEVKIPLFTPDSPPLDLGRLFIERASQANTDGASDEESQWEQCSRLLLGDPSFSSTIKPIYDSYLLPLFETMSAAGELKKGTLLSMDRVVSFMQSYAAKRKEFPSEHLIEKIEGRWKSEEEYELTKVEVEASKDSFKLFPSISDLRRVVGAARDGLNKVQEQGGEESIKALPRLAIKMLKSLARNPSYHEADPILYDASEVLASPQPKTKVGKLSTKQSPTAAAAMAGGEGPSASRPPPGPSTSSHPTVIQWTNSSPYLSLLSSAKIIPNASAAPRVHPQVTTESLVDDYISRLTAAGSFKKGSRWKDMEGGEEGKDFVYWKRPTPFTRVKSGGSQRRSRGVGSGGAIRKGKTPAPRCGKCSNCINVATGKQACFFNRTRIESGQKPIFMSEDKEKEYVARFGKLWEDDMWKKYQN